MWFGVSEQRIRELFREAKEAAMRESIQHGGTTAALLGLTDTMRRLGLE